MRREREGRGGAGGAATYFTPPTSTPSLPAPNNSILANNTSTSQHCDGKTCIGTASWKASLHSSTPVHAVLAPATFSRTLTPPLPKHAHPNNL
ncbi:hypothetical protein E2C01_051919 [Portunus trituberculatus]|uniref:Uncharacterized protein n=1 Tax=Portunus trituberculatus TaxID=210409 RepID=A0A5B7GKZ1_PORTR|nr:hypothetical protein [Portunus trituberculatus]